jgi:hypothetical protein
VCVELIDLGADVNSQAGYEGSFKARSRLYYKNKNKHTLGSAASTSRMTCVSSRSIVACTQVY